MRRNNFAGVVILSLLAGMAGAYVFQALGVARGAVETKMAVKETAYERVMRTQTLRCGYVVDPPHVMKDANTAALSGDIVDIMNEAGRLLNLKIEWPEEVGWGNNVEALRSRRVDAICTDYWMNPVEGRFVGYSMPLYYETVVAYGRADDYRFDNNLDAIDNPSVTVAAIDGSVNGIIPKQDFPKAKIATLPNMTDMSQVLTEVAMGKADVAFVDAVIGLRYGQNNPGKLKNLTPGRPVRAYPATIALPQNDGALKVMLDSAFVQLLYSRFVDKALERHGLPADVVYRVTRPYEVPQAAASPILSNPGESAKTLPTQ